MRKRAATATLNHNAPEIRAKRAGRDKSNKSNAGARDSNPRKRHVAARSIHFAGKGREMLRVFMEIDRYSRGDYCDMGMFVLMIITWNFSRCKSLT